MIKLVVYSVLNSKNVKTSQIKVNFNSIIRLALRLEVEEQVLAFLEVPDHLEKQVQIVIVEVMDNEELEQEDQG